MIARYTARTAQLLRALTLAVGLAAVSAYGSLPPKPNLPGPTAAPVAPLDLSGEIGAFYIERDFRPLWVTSDGLRPEAHKLLRMLGRMDGELAASFAAARNGDSHGLARADLLLSRAFVAHVQALHRPPAHSSMRYFDAALAPAEPSARAILAAAAAAPSLAEHLELVDRVNPAYDGLRRGLAVYRARWSRLPQFRLPAQPTPADLQRRLGGNSLTDFQRVHGLSSSGRADAATIAALNRGSAYYERLIEANIERARAIPGRPGERYVLVDTASARLWMIEDGRIVDSMKVIVGKPGMETPAMAAMIDQAVLNPYWIVPPDLIRQRARKVLRRGPSVIARERLQVLSDWSSHARTLDPRKVDWAAVARGRRYVALRQRAGPGNMMGAIKFMLDNPLGIYLHDTPLKEAFARADRRISSGCVRLEDAPRLARWLFEGAAPHPTGAPEQRVDLPAPVPVYITYLTAVPTRTGVQFQPDLYRRDRALLAQLFPAQRSG